MIETKRENTRIDFYKKTYLHIAGALGLFALLEGFLIKHGYDEKMFNLIQKFSYSWLIVLGLFMFVGWIADKWANSDPSEKGKQYLGLGLYILAEAIIFLPLMYLAIKLTDATVIKSAGITTAFLTLGISSFTFFIQKDFRFLGKYLMIGGWVLMGIVVAGVLFGFNFGVWFAGIITFFAGAGLLYSTSNLIHNYHEGQYVAAALAIFADIVLMFYSLIQVFLDGDD